MSGVRADHPGGRRSGIGAGGALTRREALLAAGGVTLAGGLAGLAGCAGNHNPAHSGQASGARSAGRALPIVADMVLDNPGQPPLQSSFKDPRRLAGYGYGMQVIADWVPPNAAVDLSSAVPGLFPPGSAAAAWLAKQQARIEQRTRAAHAAGLKALYHSDILLLPARLLESHGEQLLNGSGQIDFRRPFTKRLLRTAIGEAFARFPDLDGLLVRTGEVYLQSLPFHSGADPITQGPASHLELLSILREEVCVKRGKLILYRTWAFDGFNTSPGYYREVAEHVEPHPLLAFSIKHTAGDFWRTMPFNPTLGIGRHRQVVEAECAREYEGKGSHPNYIAQGVIEGFSELRAQPGPIGLADLAGNSRLAGVLTWSRGGGWNGPRIENELWCDCNAYVLSQWALGRGSEAEIFARWAKRIGSGANGEALRRLALLSADAILHGHYSTVHQLGAPAWTRDEYLGGSDQDLRSDFRQILADERVEAVIAEKYHAAALWREIAGLAGSLGGAGGGTPAFIDASSRYGALLYTAIAHGWSVMLLGMQGEAAGSLQRSRIATAIAGFDAAWSAYERLPAIGGQPASLYVPYSFAGATDAHHSPHADHSHGLLPSIEQFRRRLGLAGPRLSAHRV